jgi:hypothetical protein
MYQSAQMQESNQAVNTGADPVLKNISDRMQVCFAHPIQHCLRDSGKATQHC